MRLKGSQPARRSLWVLGLAAGSAAPVLIIMLSHVTAFIFTSVKQQPSGLGKQHSLSPGGEGRLRGQGVAAGSQHGGD